MSLFPFSALSSVYVVTQNVQTKLLRSKEKDKRPIPVVVMPPRGVLFQVRSSSGLKGRSGRQLLKRKLVRHVFEKAPCFDLPTLNIKLGLK